MKIDVLQGNRWHVSSVSAALWNVWMCDCLRCQDCYILLWRGSVHLSHSPVLGTIVYTRCQTPSVHRQVPWKAYFRKMSYYFYFWSVSLWPAVTVSVVCVCGLQDFSKVSHISYTYVSCKVADWHYCVIPVSK